MIRNLLVTTALATIVAIAAYAAGTTGSAACLNRHDAAGGARRSAAKGRRG